MANKTYIYCGSNDMSILKLCLSTVTISQFEMVTLLLGHPVYVIQVYCNLVIQNKLCINYLKFDAEL